MIFDKVKEESNKYAYGVGSVPSKYRTERGDEKSKHFRDGYLAGARYMNKEAAAFVQDQGELLIKYFDGMGAAGSVVIKIASRVRELMPKEKK